MPRLFLISRPTNPLSRGAGRLHLRVERPIAPALRVRPSLVGPSGPRFSPDSPEERREHFRSSLRGTLAALVIFLAFCASLALVAMF